MKRAASTFLVLFLLVTGCGYGPAHLPVLCRQRDHFQEIIDRIVNDMVADEEWWNSLSPQERGHWKAFLEKVRLEERERALTAIDALAEGVHRRDAAIE